MFRKLVLTLGATAVIAAAALAPTAASAKHWHHWGHHWHGGIALYPSAYAYASDCYVVTKPVWTIYGKIYKKVVVCD